MGQNKSSDQRALCIGSALDLSVQDAEWQMCRRKVAAHGRAQFACPTMLKKWFLELLRN